jgi:hypothetical protein
MSTSGEPRLTENEALIESSFRRLLSSIASERERYRNAWGEIETERSKTMAKLETLRSETDQWCKGERQKVLSEWKRVDKLREGMTVLEPSEESFDVNCSGANLTISKRLLCTIEGSLLNHMFSDGFIANIPKDADGRFFLDFNPFCFSLLLQYLQVRYDSGVEVAAQFLAPPRVPPEQQQNLDVLIEALKLKAFMPINRPNPSHGTSLKCSGIAEGRFVVEATHPGWQVISGALPLPMARLSYFEVQVIENNETKGGLTVGVCGHIPKKHEVHCIRLKDSVVYNSVIGLVGDAFAAENVAKGICLFSGSCMGVRHDAQTHSLEWYYSSKAKNRTSIGSSVIRPRSQEQLLQMFPVVALSAVGQKVEISFVARPPSSLKGDDADD